MKRVVKLRRGQEVKTNRPLRLSKTLFLPKSNDVYNLVAAIEHISSKVEEVSFMA